jgi:tRNA threonylcarbamoyl adenosine modification protein YeaZ
MNILAVEFSTDERSVAVAAFDAAGGLLVKHEELERGGRSTAAFAMIQRCLEKAGIDRTKIDRLAIGVGPGSYMGTRLAVSLAQGWHFALGTPLFSYDSLECIAAEAAEEGLKGKLLAVLDAQRGEFYIAGFELTGPTWVPILPMQIATPDQVQGYAQAGFVLAGPNLEQKFPSTSSIWPRASTGARLAIQKNESVAPELVTPIYLRETTFVKAAPSRSMIDLK